MSIPSAPDRQFSVWLPPVLSGRSPTLQFYVGATVGTTPVPSARSAHLAPTRIVRSAAGGRRAAGAALFLLLAGAGARAQTHVTALSRRQAGGALPLSIQNEVNAAVARSQEWLLRQQQPDGAWGASNRPLLTATAGLALLADGNPTPRAAAAAARAAAWLSAPAFTNCATDSEALAWREILLLALATNTVRQAAAWRAAAPHKVEAEPLAALAVAEVARLLGFPVSNDFAAVHSATNLPEQYVWLPQTKHSSSNALALTAALACEWRTPAIKAWHAGEARRAWWLARAINRCAHGELTMPGADGQPTLLLDWRHEMARDRIGRQRIDHQGGGWWQPPPGSAHGPRRRDAAIRETAFTILLLREL